jgi:hypothetical protein
MGPVLATLQKAILSRWNRDSTAYDSFFFYHMTYRQGKAGLNIPCSKPQGMFCLTAVLRSDRKKRCHFVIRSLTPPQVADAP